MKRLTRYLVTADPRDATKILPTSRSIFTTEIPKESLIPANEGTPHAPWDWNIYVLTFTVDFGQILDFEPKLSHKKAEMLLREKAKNIKLAYYVGEFHTNHVPELFQSTILSQAIDMIKIQS